MQTARLLAAHTARAATPRGDAGGIGDWRVVLRAASSYEAYLRVALPGRRHPSAPAFLLQDDALPASVTYCLAEVAAAVDELRRLSVAPADAEARAAVFAASRATALAAQPAFAVHGLSRLAERLDAVHDALASTLIPTTELADGATHAQAVRQAQN